MFCNDLITIVIGNQTQPLVSQIVGFLAQNNAPLFICESAYDAAAIIFSNDSNKCMIVSGIDELMLENGKLFEIAPAKSQITFCCIMPSSSFSNESICAITHKGVHFITRAQQVKDIRDGLANKSVSAMHETVTPITFGKKMTRVADNFITDAQSETKGRLRNAI